MTRNRVRGAHLPPRIGLAGWRKVACLLGWSAAPEPLPAAPCPPGAPPPKVSSFMPSPQSRSEADLAIGPHGGGGAPGGRQLERKLVCQNEVKSRIIIPSFEQTRNVPFRIRLFLLSIRNLLISVGRILLKPRQTVRDRPTDRPSAPRWFFFVSGNVLSTFLTRSALESETSEATPRRMFLAAVANRRRRSPESLSLQGSTAPTPPLASKKRHHQIERLG